MVALQLLRPIDALQVLGGDQADADVVQSSAKPNASGQFDLLLHMYAEQEDPHQTLWYVHQKAADRFYLPQFVKMAPHNVLIHKPPLEPHERGIP